MAWKPERFTDCYDEWVESEQPDEALELAGLNLLHQVELDPPGRAYFHHPSENEPEFERAVAYSSQQLDLYFLYLYNEADEVVRAVEIKTADWS